MANEKNVARMAGTEGDATLAWLPLGAVVWTPMHPILPSYSITLQPGIELDQLSFRGQWVKDAISATIPSRPVLPSKNFSPKSPSSAGRAIKV